MDIEKKLGLISVRQIRYNDAGKIYIQELSSHVAGSHIVSPKYPTFNSLGPIRKELTKRFKLIRLLNEYDDKERYTKGIKEALASAKKNDDARRDKQSKTFIEDWENPAIKPGIKIRL